MEDSIIVEAKALVFEAKKGQRCSRSKPRERPRVFEARAKAKAKAKSLKTKVKASELWAQKYSTCRLDVTRRNKAVN